MGRQTIRRKIGREKNAIKTQNKQLLQTSFESNLKFQLVSLQTSVALFFTNI